MSRSSNSTARSSRGAPSRPATARAAARWRKAYRKKMGADLRKRATRLADEAESEGVVIDTIAGSFDAEPLGTPATQRRVTVEAARDLAQIASGQSGAAQTAAVKVVEDLTEEVDELEDAVEDLVEHIEKVGKGGNVYEVDLEVVPVGPAQGVRVRGQVRRRNSGARAYVLRADGQLGGEEAIVWGGVGRHRKTGEVSAVMRIQPVYRTPTGWSAKGDSRLVKFQIPRGQEGDLEAMAWSMRDHLIKEMGFRGPVGAPKAHTLGGMTSRQPNARRLKRTLT